RSVHRMWSCINCQCINMTGMGSGAHPCFSLLTQLITPSHGCLYDIFISMLAHTHTHTHTHRKRHRHRHRHRPKHKHTHTHTHRHKHTHTDTNTHTHTPIN